jgi:hypothetical protein
MNNDIFSKNGFEFYCEIEELGSEMVQKMGLPKLPYFNSFYKWIDVSSGRYQAPHPNTRVWDKKNDQYLYDLMLKDVEKIQDEWNLPKGISIQIPPRVGLDQACYVRKVLCLRISFSRENDGVIEVRNPKLQIEVLNSLTNIRWKGYQQDLPVLSATAVLEKRDGSFWEVYVSRDVGIRTGHPPYGSLRGAIQIARRKPKPKNNVFLSKRAKRRHRHAA